MPPEPPSRRPPPPGPDQPEPEPVALPVSDQLDLHTFRPQEIVDLTGDYIEEAVRNGFRQVRLIHGKGKGVQKELVRRVLKGHPLVEGFEDAPPEAGGWGATLVWLKPRQS